LDLSLNVATWISENVRERRIAVLLPVGVIVNLGIVLADKIPVSFNLTVGSTMSFVSIEKSKVKTGLTVKVLKEKLNDFPGRRRTIEIENILKSLFLFFAHFSR